MILNLMFHDDWEIFGDGSGDVSTSMIKPASQILKVCNKYQVPYTFFVEVGQQFAMLNSEFFYHNEDAKLWEAFLKGAVSEGHDVQLHFHPQWIDANWEGNQWKLNFAKWSIANLPYKEIKHWLYKGKEYLENLLQPSAPGYKTVAFRAGSWMAQPSGNLIKALLEIGIVADCTVIKGKKVDVGKMGSIDFSNAPSSFLPWYASSWDVATLGRANPGLICIPTYSEITYVHPALFEILYNFQSVFFGIKRNFHFYRKIKRYSGFESIRPHHLKEISHYSFLSKLSAPHTYYLDFGKYHYKTIFKTIRVLVELCKSRELQNVPVILLTHSKSFYDINNFERLLNALSDLHEISFSRTQDAVENINREIILKNDR